MRDWQFWMIVTLYWITMGMFVPFPFSMFYLLIGFGFGVGTGFMMRLEHYKDQIDRKLQRLQFEIIHSDLVEIHNALKGRKYANKTRNKS